MADIASGAADTAEPMARAANVYLDVDVPDHDLIADPQRIMQALINLLTNAIKFSPNAGTVTLAGHRDDSASTFVVTDRGRGIPPEQTGRIFDWHAQVNPDTDSRMSHGAGLGLAITYAIVQAHRGTITVHSTPTEGTRFTIRLPHVTDGRASVPAQAPGPVPGVPE